MTVDTCDRPIRTASGDVVATCNLRKGHLGKCAEVDWRGTGWAAFTEVEK